MPRLKIYRYEEPEVLALVVSKNKSLALKALGEESTGWEQQYLHLMIAQPDGRDYEYYSLDAKEGSKHITYG